MQAICMGLPLNIHLVLDELNKQFPDTINIIIWDNAPFHKSKILGPLYLFAKKGESYL